MGALRSKVLDDITHARLVNWGRWHHHNPGRSAAHPLARLMQKPFASSGPAPDDLDAEAVEYVLIACKLASVVGLMYYKILLIEYVYKASSIEVRRDSARRALRRPVSRTAYYDILAAARDWAQDCLRVFAGIDGRT